MDGPRRGTGAKTRFFAGLLLGGYGALILLRVLAHESPIVGTALLLLGGALLLTGGTAPHAPSPPRTSRAALALGLAAAGGVASYNIATRSTLSTPELAILGYGVALIAASRHMDRRLGRVTLGDAVAWSLPLLAAPLALYALDAALDATRGSSPLDAAIERLLVAPMAWTLGAIGFDAHASGQTVLLGTPRGRLALSVGVVCAGLQPGILFLGILGLHAWRRNTPPARLALLLLVGLAGVHIVNLLRLIALALVGHAWGGAALMTTHAHAGWALFVGWMLLFWGLLLHHLEGPARRRAQEST